MQDYVDDEEHGAGRALLKFMQEQDLNHKAIFVVRICGRTKLQQDRVPSYIRAAESVMRLNDYNAITQRKQPLKQVSAAKSGNDRTKQDEARSKMKQDGHKEKRKYVVTSYNSRGKKGTTQSTRGRREGTSYSGAVKS